ncbi:MAG: ABC transporter substrate-binding protein [Chloroflexi bacterium]|nr:ABC transporter substrate-binding protein [Chloroflexota bacterium]
MLTKATLPSQRDISEDGTEITFYLRQGMTFQDGNAVFPEGEGREVVADDVVYSMNRLMTTEGASVASDLSAAYESIEAIDDYTVKLTLSQPNGIIFDGARGISFLAIYPREAVEQLGDDIRTNPIGSGPFEFVEYVVDDHITLQRNEDFYIRPNLDGIEFRIIPDAVTEVLALEAGEIDVMAGASLPNTDIARFRDNPDFEVIDTLITFTTQIIVNVNVPLYSDIKMREAIAKAIDGRGILRAVYGEVVVEGCGQTGPGWPGYNPDLCQYFPYEPDTSRAILAELGWADRNGDGILDKDGQPLTIEFEAWNLPEMPRVM